MHEDLATTLIIMALNLVWLAPVLVLLYWLMQPARRRKRVLLQRALDDYKSARGTDQKSLLGRSLRPAQEQLRAIKQKIDSLEEEAASAKQLCVDEFLAHLEAKIVEEEFGNVPGVGPKLRKNILGEVFYGRLRDLHNASQVRGVGASKQRDIDDWIAQSESRISEGTYTDAKAKARFEHTYREQNTALAAQVEQLQTQHKTLASAVEQAGQASKRFEAVRLDHFQKALAASEAASSIPDWYFRGMYAAWEPIPDWFRMVTQPEQRGP